jgi:hypothetical protein
MPPMLRLLRSEKRRDAIRAVLVSHDGVSPNRAELSVVEIAEASELIRRLINRAAHPPAIMTADPNQPRGPIACPSARPR